MYLDGYGLLSDNNHIARYKIQDDTILLLQIKSIRFDNYNEIMGESVRMFASFDNGEFWNQDTDKLEETFGSLNQLRHRFREAANIFGYNIRLYTIVYKTVKPYF